MGYSLPGSSVHRILQARILEWVAIPFSRDLPDPGIKPGSPTLWVDPLPSEPPGKPRKNLLKVNEPKSSGWRRGPRGQRLVFQNLLEVMRSLLRAGRLWRMQHLVPWFRLEWPNMSICQRLRGCPGCRTFSAKTKAHWDSWSPRSGLGHCLLDFSRLLPAALLSFGPLLPDDCCQTQLLPSALFPTLQRLPWPLGSSSNPRAWPPELFLHWFLPSLKDSFPITFTTHQIQSLFPNQEVPFAILGLYPWWSIYQPD